MDNLASWFPYREFRPFQEKMLSVGERCAIEGGIAMIDAPTGSGKSSLVSALLAGRNGRKVVVAVRTISQLNTFIRELELVRTKCPGLRYAYLIGKSTMCPLRSAGDVYRRCEGLKAASTTLMRQRAERGSLVPSKDPLILQQIRRLDESHPHICPYFIRSKVFVQGEVSGLKMIPSAALKTKAERAGSQCVNPGQLRAHCGDLCPYETMLLAAQHAEVVLLNYHHLFHDQVREQIYHSFGWEAQDVILLIDEAHNCGEVMQQVQSVEIDEGVLEQAGHELASLKRQVSNTDAAAVIIPRISEFMAGVSCSHEPEDWFDPVIFDRMVVRGSLTGTLSEIVQDLMRLSEKIRERNIRSGEYRVTAIERLTEFLFRLSQSASDPSFLTVYRKQDEGIRLEVRNIDPAGKLRELAGMHHACLLVSGTLSPVGSYRKYFFEDLAVTPCSLPNAFPLENRIVLCAEDVTTAYKTRQDKGNSDRIQGYIEAFSSLPGNLAVYFPSYQILDNYTQRCKKTLAKRQVFIEPKDAPEAARMLSKFLSLPDEGDSGILLGVAGGKWSEGLDYRGEMLSAAMVVGLPLAPYTRVRKMVIDYFRRKYGEEGEFISYTLPAVNRAQQALGRVLRSPEDRGMLVFAEKRFLEPRTRAGLPEWVRTEMIRCDLVSFEGAVRRWK